MPETSVKSTLMGSVDGKGRYEGKIEEGKLEGKKRLSKSSTV